MNSICSLPCFHSRIFGAQDTFLEPAIRFEMANGVHICGGNHCGSFLNTKPVFEISQQHGIRLAEYAMQAVPKLAVR